MGVWRWSIAISALTLVLCATRGTAAPYDVRAHGALGDGAAKDTDAVQRTIDACAAAGGGTVLFSAGTYLCGSIHLRSNVTLRLEAGATIKGSPNRADYDAPEKLAFPNDADEETSYFHHALMWGESLERVAILGEGTIDCNFTKRRGPKAIALKRCRFVDIKGIRLLNCPNYNISLLGTDFVNIDGVTILNGYADGIDPDSCRNVRIFNCHIQSHDDAIVPKSSFALGERRACENITVTNCYLATDCFCFKLGTESGGDFRYIAVSNCVFDSKIPERRAQAGIALETVDGANIVGVVVSNITMNRVQAPVFLRLGNRGRDMPAPSPGTLRDVIISDIVATNASATSSITGVPGARVRGVTLSNISVSFEAVPLAPAAGEQVPEVIAKYPVAAMFGPLPAYGLYCRHADGLVLRNLRFTLPNARPPGTAPASALICDDVTGLRLDGLWSSPVPASVPVVDLADVRGALIQGAVAPADAATYLRVRGSTSRDVSVLSNDLSGARVPVECAGDVRRDAVRMDRGRVRRAVTR